MIPFTDGEPVASPSTSTAALDIMTNADTSRCPDDCFRPAGLAVDGQGRVFMTSDSTGEIYVIVRTGASTGTSGDSASSPTATSRPSVGGRSWDGGLSVFWVVMIVIGCLL